MEVCDGYSQSDCIIKSYSQLSTDIDDMKKSKTSYLDYLSRIKDDKYKDYISMSEQINMYL